MRGSLQKSLTTSSLWFLPPSPRPTTSRSAGARSLVPGSEDIDGPVATKPMKLFYKFSAWLLAFVVSVPAFLCVLVLSASLLGMCFFGFLTVHLIDEALSN